MIKSIELVNIQGHKDSNLAFSEGVNVIVGQSDSGKSSIIRGEEWLRTNRPSGDTLRNWSSSSKDQMAVQMELSTGGLVTITREKDKTSYVLIDGDDYPEFSALKTDVPKEITEALNLADYNVQPQHSTYFLLQDTPGEVARQLNALVGLDVIDSAFKKIDSRLRDTTSQIKSLKVQRNSLEESLEKFKNLEAIGKLIDNIEKKQAEIEENNRSINDLKKIEASLTKISEERESLKPFLEVEPKVLEILNKATETLKAIKEKENLEMLLSDLTTIKEERKKAEIWVSLKSVQSQLADRIDKLVEMTKEKVSLERFSQEFSAILEKKEKIKLTLVTLQSKYAEALVKAGICPTCGSKVSEDTVRQFIQKGDL